HLATAHMISKIRTAPYIALPGEFEPGAQRWCIYDCNALGDPSLKIWTDEPTGTGIAGMQNKVSMSVFPVPAKDIATLQFSLEQPAHVTITIVDELGKSLQMIAEGEQTSGRHELQLNLKSLAAGIYFCKIRANESETVKKILVID
ncbi:MAG: T9SS type A sorting domain-containing protein, partial [Syntrophothermus sp.]